MKAICGFQLHDTCATHELTAMLAALPDYGKIRAQWTDGAVGLGCRHAAATNGDGAERSPCLDREAGVAVAGDARLDDRDTLCSALGVPPVERSALTDVSLILRAWLRWGRDCPNHLLGDYAFAVWDARKRTFFCARDHAGVRPFYYCLAPRGFVFASAVEAVLAMPDVSGALDEATVAAFLTSTGWNTTTRTFSRKCASCRPAMRSPLRESHFQEMACGRASSAIGIPNAHRHHDQPPTTPMPRSSWLCTHRR